MAMDDPDRLPASSRALSHDHSFVGNTTTNAYSTLRTLRGGSSHVQAHRRDRRLLDADAAAERQMVPPAGATVYYRRKTLAPLRAFPAGFKLIAGDRHATAPQGRQITYWNLRAQPARCPRRRKCRQCPDTRGQSLAPARETSPAAGTARTSTAPIHQSHMAYAVRGACPASHPVALPGNLADLPLPGHGRCGRDALLRRPVLGARGLLQRSAAGHARARS
jgi:hypothetical protein